LNHALEKNVPGKQRKEREISITFFHPLPPTVFSARLAPDADRRGAEVLTQFVVAGGKIDEKASYLTLLFFPAKNY
jgi:hypothetical protein